MFWRYMQIGGFMMWPLLICSVLLGAILVERAWSVLIKQRLFGRSISQASRAWHRRVLPFFTDVPPSLGLLGTVIGVVQSFELVQGRLNGQAVGAGLGVACLTTVFGLSIAIVAAVSVYLLDWTVGTDRRQKEPTTC